MATKGEETKKKTTTKKTAPKKETVKEEKVVVEEPKKEEKTGKRETRTGINKNGELALVYLVSVLGLIFSLVKDDSVSEEMIFHYNQAGTICIIFAGLALVSGIFEAFSELFSFIFGPLAAVLVVFTLIALVKACNGEQYKIPIIDDLSKSIWK